jgi:hypothetical protein
MERNKKTFHYALYKEKVHYTDEDGNESGEFRTVYEAPVEMRANISPATGISSIEQFGNDIKYDKVIITDDLTCPIDENSVLFVDVSPNEDAYGNLLFDYVVKKIARSLNSISIAISKVEVS